LPQRRGWPRSNDAWAVEHSVRGRVNVRAFLQWSAANRLSPRFELPATQGLSGTPLPERDRTRLLGRLLTEDRTPLRTRVAAVVLLLYAQPVSLITRLTVDIIRDGDQVLRRLGDPPSPMPGYRQVTTAPLAAEAGAIWSNYAPDDRGH
jgi:hypothetical protein